MTDTEGRKLPARAEPVRKHAARARGETVSEGEYWAYEGTEALGREGGEAQAETGDVLLVTEVKVYEGEVHAVELRVHPKRLRPGQSQHVRVAAEAFFAHWRKSDGLARRAEEKAAIKRRINDEEGAIERLTRTADTLRIAWKPEHGESGARTLARVEARTKDLEAVQREVALAAQRIEEGVQALAPYVEEEMEFVRASHARALREVEEAERASATLKLYAGTGVEVIHWNSDGEPAAPETPVTVYQRTRYVDEESLYHVLDGGEGADASDTGRYLRSLVRDPARRRRVVPAERCVVAMQPRRHEKRSPGIGFGGGRGDRTAFLVVRNGERITSVHWDTGRWKRLVPRRDTWRECFREDDRWSRGDEAQEPRWIGPDDVGFVDTLERAQATMRSYLTAWVVLAGAHLREQIFAPLAAEQALGRPLNLMMPEDHDRIVTLVRDEEDGLRMGHRTWESERAELNAAVRAGGRVVVHAAKAIEPRQRNWYDQRSWSYDARGPRQIDHPKSARPQVLRVRRRRGQFTVACETAGGGTRSLALIEDAPWWLWIEDADIETLEMHIEHGREDYEEMAPLAITARRVLREDARGDLDLETDARTAVRALRALGAHADPRARARLAPCAGQEDAWRAWADERFGAGRWVEIGCTARGTLIATVLADPADPESEQAGVLWARRFTLSARDDGRPKGARRRGWGCWGAERSLWTNPQIGATLRARIDGRRRRLTHAEAQAMHEAVGASATEGRAWLEALGKSAAARTAYADRLRAEQAQARAEARPERNLALIPVAVVAHTHPALGGRGAGTLCLRMQALDVLAGWGGREGARAAHALALGSRRLDIAHGYRKGAVNAKGRGDWVVVGDARHLRAPTPWAPLRVAWTQETWWEKIGDVEDVRIDNDAELRVKVARTMMRRAKRSAPSGWRVVEHALEDGLGAIEWIDASDEDDKRSNRGEEKGRWR